MTLQSARDDIYRGLVEIDRILMEDGSTVKVSPGDNIASMIEANPPDTIFRCAHDYIYSGPDFDINKPCQVINEDIHNVPDVRVTNEFHGPTIRAQLGIKVPKVKFTAIRIEGTNKNKKLILTGYEGEDTTAFTLDRCVVQGSDEGQWCGISVYGEYFTMLKSHVGNCWYQGRDSQAVASERGMKHAVLDDCFLEGSGENFMLGGGDLQSEFNIPFDILIHNCHFFKPLTWKSKPGSVKNLFEIKAGKNVRITQCLFENNWVDAQAGAGIVLTVRNQYGRDPYAIIENVSFTNNILKNSAGGFNVLGRDDSQTSQIMNALNICNFRIQGLDYNTNGGNGRAFQITGGPKNVLLDGVTIDRMPGVTTEDPVAGFLFFGDAQHKAENMKIKNSFFIEGEYGIHTDGATLGAPALAVGAPGCEWENITVQQSNYRWINYPPGTVLLP